MLADDKKASSEYTPNDFGIEKHGFKLPPPFYPTRLPVQSSQSRCASSEKGLEALQISFADPPPGTAPGSSSITFGAFEESDSSSPTLPAATTVNADNQSTSPTDAPKTPGHFSYHGYTHAYPIVDRHSTWSLHQSQLVPQQHAYLPFRYGYSNGPTYYAQPSTFYPTRNLPPLTPSATPLHKVSDGWPTPDDPYVSTSSSASITGSEARPVAVDKGVSSENLFQGQPDTGVYLGSAPHSQGESPASRYDSVLLQNSQRWTEHSAPFGSRHHDSYGHLAALSSYLLQQMNRDQFADCRLHVKHGKLRVHESNFALHSLLIAQNPKLNALLSQAEVGNDGMRILRLTTSNHFITKSAIKAVLRFYYGEPLSAFETSLYKKCQHKSRNRDPSPQINSASLMDSSLAYAAAGALLEIPEVVLQGIRIAMEGLCLGNVEKALCFALDWDKESSFWQRSEDLQSPSSSGKQSCLPSSNLLNQSSRSYPDQEAFVPAFSVQGYPSDVRYLLFACLKVVAYKISASFNLVVSAENLPCIDRLPRLASKDKGRAVSTSKSRLSTIQFGDYVVEGSVSTDPEASKISSILLSLPFDPLDYIVKLLDHQTRQRIIPSLVQERERRRIKFLQESETSQNRGQEIDLGKEAHWEEQVADIESEATITRKWVDEIFQTEECKEV